MLSLKNVSLMYGAIRAVEDLSIRVDHGQIVALLGANGAGKSTTLRAISGLKPLHKGEIYFQGKSLANLKPHQIVLAGISQVPEGRRIFSHLTIAENLQLGAYQRKKSEIRSDLEKIFTLFPRLHERLTQKGGTLSGGEQQMLAIGRALMSCPQLLILDEPSLGIAPVLVQTIYEKMIEINQKMGLPLLLVEQNAHLALQVSNYAYVLETGHLILEGPAKELAKRDDIRKAYLGH